MKIKREAQLITTLIIDDIVNTMIVHGLQRLGFDAGDYHLSVSDVIFKLMGYDNRCDEPIYERYLELSRKVVKKHVKPDREKLEEPAREIYKYLCKNRPQK
jgi:hypothetical protein